MSNNVDEVIDELSKIEMAATSILCESEKEKEEYEKLTCRKIKEFDERVNKETEESLANLFFAKPVIGEIVAGLVGLIPNCASSVVITQLYLEGVIGFGAMMSGLLVGSGVGLLVLFRVNESLKDNLRILAVLYGIGVGCGILLGFIF